VDQDGEQFSTDGYRPQDHVHAYAEKLEHLQPKEYFGEAVKLISQRFGKQEISFLDIGCANGAFLFHAKHFLNFNRSVGIDISDTLLDIAKYNIPDSEFHLRSLFDINSDEIGKFDVCTCLGTIAIFDDFESTMRSLLGLVKDNGLALILDLVNDYPVDSLMRFKKVSDRPEQDYWQPGFNVRSIATYRNVLTNIDEGWQVSFKDFVMPFAIQESDDPMRAWTISTDSNEYELVIGTSQMLKMKFACISRENHWYDKETESLLDD